MDGSASGHLKHDVECATVIIYAKPALSCYLASVIWNQVPSVWEVHKNFSVRHLKNIFQNGSFRNKTHVWCINLAHKKNSNIRKITLCAQGSGLHGWGASTFVVTVNGNMEQFLSFGQNKRHACGDVSFKGRIMLWKMYLLMRCFYITF